MKWSLSMIKKKKRARKYHDITGWGWGAGMRSSCGFQPGRRPEMSFGFVGGEQSSPTPSSDAQGKEGTAVEFHPLALRLTVDKDNSSGPCCFQAFP